MEQPIQTMTRLIRCGITREAWPAEWSFDASQDTPESLYRLSKTHDLAHVVACALQQNGLLTAGETADAFEKEMMTAVCRYEQLAFEYDRIQTVLQTANVPYMPLKGAVIRQYYPEPWMRTSCDIDILIHEDDLAKATEVLTRELRYQLSEKSSHDWSFYAPNGVHLELHHTLIEPGSVRGADPLLTRVWEYAAPIPEEDPYRFHMQDAMFYFYHVAHMAKHIEIGGCGVRPFLDLWVLNHRVNGDRAPREQLLRAGGLLTFERAAARLSEVWFSGAEPDALTNSLQAFVLAGGLFGTFKTRVAVERQKKGGTVRYFLSRIFLPYDVLKYRYPVLQKHKWLTPFMQVRRWCRLPFGKRLKRVKKEMRANSSLSSEQQAAVAEMLRQLDLV